VADRAREPAFADAHRHRTGLTAEGSFEPHLNMFFVTSRHP
jgi:hypothetical protein